MAATGRNNGRATRLTLNIHLGISWRGGSRTKRATICAQVFQLVAEHVSWPGERSVKHMDHAHAQLTSLQSGEMTALSAGLHRPMIMGAMTILITDRANSPNAPMVTDGWHSSGRGRRRIAAGREGVHWEYTAKKAHAKAKKKNKRQRKRKRKKRTAREMRLGSADSKKRKLKTAKQGSKKVKWVKEKYLKLLLLFFFVLNCVNSGALCTATGNPKPSSAGSGAGKKKKGD